MPIARACPDSARYQGLASGELSPPECESLLSHLEGCESCVRRLESLPEDDALVRLIRQARAEGEPPVAATLAGLIARLRKSRPGPGDAGAAPIVVQCPGCGKRLKAKADQAGRTARCPKCRAAIAVPAAAVAGEAPTVLPAGSETAALVEPANVTGVRAVGPTGSYHRPEPDARERELCEFLAPAQAPDELGRLGPYRVLEVLGAGGMGVVFRAEDPELRRPVALKAMLPSLGASQSARKRFLREAQAAAAITHDNIVHIYQVGEDRGAPFIAMQFLDGESLEARLRRERRLPVAEALRIGRETAEGLAAAHERGLIHRDIKPANLWLEGAKGRVKVLDFGLARGAADEGHLTQSGAIVGTPAYMAPEQAGGKKVDHRCDLFSLGCVLYRLTTGALPFKGSDTLSILAALAIVDPEPPAALNPEIPEELSDLVMRLLAKDADRRPASARDVAEAIQAIEGGIGKESARPRDARKGASGRQYVRAAGGRWNKRLPPWPWLLGMAGGFAALVAGIAILWPTPRGVVRIDSADPNVRVVFDKDGAAVTGAGKDEIRLRPGEHGILVRRGDFEFQTEKLLLQRGETISLRVEVLPGRIQVTADGRIIGAGGLPTIAENGQDGGFKPLFNGKDLTGWTVDSGDQNAWLVKDGELVCCGTEADGLAEQGYLLTRRDYSDFILRFQFRQAADVPTFSGLALRAMPGETANDSMPSRRGTPIPFHLTLATAFSLPDYPQAGTGFLWWSFDSRAQQPLLPDRQADVHPVGEWNAMEIESRGQRLRVSVNGREILDAMLNKIRRPENPAPGLSRFRGRLGFLKRRGQVRYRNIEIKELSAEGPAPNPVTGLDHNAAVKPELPTSSAPLDADRKAAERMLAVGGVIRIETDGKARDVDTVGRLPPSPFKLIHVGLYGNEKVSDADLACFDGCKNLRVLNLQSLSVTDAGLVHFKGCKNLVVLCLFGDRITDAGLANFNDCTDLEELRLHLMKMVTDRGMAHFKACKDLRILELYGTPITDAGLAAFQNCKDLTQLHLGATLITDRGLAYFADCNNLRQLGLGAMPVNEAWLAKLKNCQQLGTLWLDSTPVTDAGLDQLHGLRGLRHLYLGKTKVTSAGVARLLEAVPECVIHDGPAAAGSDATVRGADPDRRAAEYVLSIGGSINIQVGTSERPVDPGNYLPRLPFKLSLANLYHNEKVSDNGLVCFEGCDNLRDVNLQTEKVTDAGLAHFKHCKTLTHLWLSYNNITDAGLANFKDNKGLKKLSLHMMALVTDRGLAYFQGCKDLELLILYGTPVGDAGLVQFRNCKDLSEVDLGGTLVSDAGLEFFTDCKDLRRLQLTHTRVGDAGLVHVRNCKRLALLGLDTTKVTDAGLPQLHDLRSLRQLSLRETKVTASGVKKLATALPECKIEWDGGVIAPR